jgi:hypothetical protein
LLCFGDLLESVVQIWQFQKNPFKFGDFDTFLPKNILHLVTLDFLLPQRFPQKRKKRKKGEKGWKCLHLTNYSIT